MHPTLSEEELLNKFWNGTSLPQCCLTLGYEATTTVENAIETKQWARANNVKTIRLLTSDYHLNRAMLELQHAAPELEVLAHPIPHHDRDHNQKLFWKVAFREYHKTIFRWITMVVLNPKNDISHSQEQEAVS